MLKETKLILRLKMTRGAKSPEPQGLPATQARRSLTLPPLPWQPAWRQALCGAVPPWRLAPAVPATNFSNLQGRNRRAARTHYCPLFRKSNVTQDFGYTLLGRCQPAGNSSYLSQHFFTLAGRPRNHLAHSRESGKSPAEEGHELLRARALLFCFTKARPA